jgi:hypothetical protein
MAAEGHLNLNVLLQYIPVIPKASGNGNYGHVPDVQLLIAERVVIENREPRHCAEVTTFYTYPEQTPFKAFF